MCTAAAPHLCCRMYWSSSRELLVPRTCSHTRSKHTNQRSQAERAPACKQRRPRPPAHAPLRSCCPAADAVPCAGRQGKRAAGTHCVGGAARHDGLVGDQPAPAVFAEQRHPVALAAAGKAEGRVWGRACSVGEAAAPGLCPAPSLWAMHARRRFIHRRRPLPRRLPHPPPHG